MTQTIAMALLISFLPIYAGASEIQILNELDAKWSPYEKPSYFRVSSPCKGEPWRSDETGDPWHTSWREAGERLTSSVARVRIKWISDDWKSFEDAASRVSKFVNSPQPGLTGFATWSEGASWTIKSVFAIVDYKNGESGKFELFQYNYFCIQDDVGLFWWARW